MKILFVNYEYPPLGGGGGVAMMEVAQEMATRHQVHVLTSAGPALGSLEKHPSVDLTVHRTRSLPRIDRATASFGSMAAFLPFGIAEGNRILKAGKFDVVNTWFAVPSGITGSAIARRNGVPHLLTVIGGDIYDPSKWYSPHRFLPAGMAVKKILREADAHVAISSDIADRTRKYFNFDRPVEVIPLGIKEPKWTPVGREELGMNPERMYIVAVGRLVRRKDHPTLLRSFASLNREDTELVLLGDGPERENLQGLAKELGIQDRVNLRGFVTDEIKYQVLSNSDVFALVSLHEGFGIVYLEALYCGLPVIAANEGGQLDLLEDGKTGRLVPVGDVGALTKALGECLSDEVQTEEVRQANQQRFNQFSIANLALRYERAFEKLIQRSGA